MEPLAPRAILHGASCEVVEAEICRQRFFRLNRLRGEALADGRQAPQQHGCGGVQACRSRPDLPQVHLRQLRGAPGQAPLRKRRLRRRQSRRRRRIPGGERLLGAGRGPLVASPGERQAAVDREARRRRDGRHRARQSPAQGGAPQGLRPPGPRQAASRRADRSHRHHQPHRLQPTLPQSLSLWEREERSGG